MSDDVVLLDKVEASFSDLVIPSSHMNESTMNGEVQLNSNNSINEKIMDTKDILTDTELTAAITKTDSGSIKTNETDTSSSQYLVYYTNPLEPVPKFLKVVDGIDKLRRVIAKELARTNIDDKCSNLPHLLSIAQYLLQPETMTLSDSPTGWTPSESKPPSAVLKPFTYVPKKLKTPLRLDVDIVSPDGDEWCKLSARNPKALALLAIGAGGYKQKSMLDHAKDYVECAKQNHSFFKPPRVKFVFASGIGVTLCAKLESLGIIVEGKRIEDEDLAIHPRLKPYEGLLCESDSNSEEGSSSANNNQSGGEDSVDGNHGILKNGIQLSTLSKKEILLVSKIPSILSIRNPSMEGIVKLNLDITALLAYVSNITNGHTNVEFRSKLLSEQLEFEKKHPQKPVLDSVFKGRELYCCETAMKEFMQILQTVGGIQEKHRAVELCRRLRVVPDNISERSRSLFVVGCIKLRSVTIFGTGDSIQAVTVTANSGFLRSAKSQGIEYPVFLHESRALTEEKENLKLYLSYL